MKCDHECKSCRFNETCVSSIYATNIKTVDTEVGPLFELSDEDVDEIDEMYNIDDEEEYDEDE